MNQDWNGNYWENHGLCIKTYQEENILATELHQYWDGTKWENSSQKLCRFENNIPAGYLAQEWEGGVWINQLQYIDHFDKDNLLNSSVFWRYDDFGIVTKGDSTQYFYRTLTDAGELLQVHETVSIFPNPCNGKFRISSPDHIDGITFFSILGERLYFKEGSSQKETHDIDISGFGSGIYFMVLESGGHKNTQKVVVQ